MPNSEREELLEAELQQARNTIGFLHDCLTGRATYAYPEMTISFLEELGTILPENYWCIHSTGREPGCLGCEQGERYRTARARHREAQDVESTGTDAS